VLLKAPAVMEVDSGCYEIGLLEYSNFGATETSAQICGRLQEKLRLLRVIHQEQPRPLRTSVGDLVPYSDNSGSYITTRHFVLSYSSLLHHNMACII